MDKQLLEILVCPVTGAAVSLADSATLERVNARVAEGVLRDDGGSAVEQPLTAALITADGVALYPVDDDIPMLLPERRIELGRSA